MSDVINEEERHKAATEEPTNGAAGVRALPVNLPGGFDGVEPEKNLEELKRRGDLEEMNAILFERLGEISRKCSAMRVECDPEHADADAAETNLKLVSALSELRQMCDFCKSREKPIDPTAPEMKKASKFGLLANGVQMVRYAGGSMVTLIGKRDRGPCERQGGRTGKVIYKVTVSRETHSAEIIADGAALCTVFTKSSSRLEHYGLALLNSWLKFNAKQHRHAKDRLKRRKAEEVAK